MTEKKTVGKDENAGYQYFLPFPVFFKPLSFKVVKSRDCVVKTQSKILTVNKLSPSCFSSIWLVLDIRGRIVHVKSLLNEN